MGDEERRDIGRGEKDLVLDLAVVRVEDLQTMVETLVRQPLQTRSEPPPPRTDDLPSALGAVSPFIDSLAWGGCIGVPTRQGQGEQLSQFS